jgi:hypothetical protein
MNSAMMLGRWADGQVFGRSRKRGIGPVVFDEFCKMYQFDL